MKFDIIEDRKRFIGRFNTQGRFLKFKLSKMPEVNTDPIQWFKEGIEEIITYGLKDLQPADLVGITFCDNQFKRGMGWVAFKSVSEIKWADIWGLLLKIYQSNSVGISTDNFCLSITSVRLPKGSGKRSKFYQNFNEECSKRKGIIPIKNNDNLCLPRALVVAMAVGTPEYSKVRRNIGNIQTQRTVDLCAAVCVNIPTDGCSVRELEIFQAHLSKYKITVYKHGSKGRDLLYQGPNAINNINLLYHDGHFNVITSLTAAFVCSYYCESCHIPYDHKDRHRCEVICLYCQESPPCSLVIQINCIDCNRQFRSQQCYNNHRKNNTCKNVKRCLDCLKIYNVKARKDMPHVCGEIFCKICKTFKSSDHLCFIQPNSKLPNQKSLLFLFYDFETRQETPVSSSDGSDNNAWLHEPNLCIFNQCCDLCMTDENVSVCKQCGVREQILKGSSCVEGLLIHLLESRKKYKNIIAIAHNAQGFDAQFILNFILKYRSELAPELIMRGSKILLMSIGSIKFIDSLNYFPMPLAELPKAFGLTALKKGYFPHLFNTMSNQNYVGPMPDVSYYSPGTMKPHEQLKFLEWYESNKTNIFNFQSELIAYCQSDVYILKRACLQFRDLFMKECNVCPFTEATTIASACNLVYRRGYLKHETLGVIPQRGYRRLCDNQSRVALQWLIWVEKELGINIQHAGRGREAVLNGLKVDGFCADTNHVFEFHGCYFHGHSCIKFNRTKPLHEDPDDTLDRRLERTATKTQCLRQRGYTVTEMWECNFLKLCKQEQQILEYTEHHPLLVKTPLNPRDAFYGGRTETIKSYYAVKNSVDDDDAEQIRYKDFCSLYPWVCKYGKFPVGHPDVYVGHSVCLPLLSSSTTDGLVKCTILPLRTLYHPVLPLKLRDKLLFTLCYACGRKPSEERLECSHNESERALTGTWVLDEVRKAIEMGYEILEIHEMWVYKTEVGLFASFINKFLKIKQEASGWPTECQTQDDRDRYIENYFEREGIQLDSDRITKNPGLRSLAKLMLNSFWGKFGQRENQQKTVIIRNTDDYFSLFSNPSIEVCHVTLTSDDKTVLVNYQFREEAADVLPTVNVAIAAYTTTQARLKLYREFQKLGERVLYGDTDSILYVSKPGMYEPSCGNFLGELTDELEGDYGVGSYIVKFISGGPKTYAFKVYCPKTNEYKSVCKFKGITLNYDNLQMINFDTLEELVLKHHGPSNDNACVKISFNNIARTETHDVITLRQTKTFKVTLGKRKIVENFDSVPFGYCSNSNKKPSEKCDTYK